MNQYTYKEAYDQTLSYFNGDELATGVFIEKYALRDKEGNLLESNPSMMFRRIAKEFARIEKGKFKNPLTEDQIFELFDHFKYIVPAGSPLFGIGNEFQIISLSNCFFCEIPEDSYSAILKVDEQFVNICKRRGGVGVCLDKLRPEGVQTNNAARTSTGIIPFLERYSNTIREVGQEGRRGAGIAILSVHHPQILDFATVKNDDKKVTGLNISVKLSNEFMEAVDKDTEYEIRFPVDYKERNVKPIISKMVKAREVWNTIIKSAHNRGEPGLLMWDNITRETPADAYEEFASKGCNPSLRKGTLVLTKEGPREIQDLENKFFEVYNLEGKYSKAKCKLSGKNQILYEVCLNTGMIYHCTAEHRWATRRGELTTLQIRPGDKLPTLRKKDIFNGNLGDFDDGFLIGWFIGDGWKVIRKDTNRNQYGLICSEKDFNSGIGKELIRILQEKTGYKGEFHKRERKNSTWYELNTCNLKIDNYFNKFYNPDKINGINKKLICESSEIFIKGLINGYLSSDGNIYKNKRISFSSSIKYKKLLLDISEILGFFGIKTTLKYIPPRKIIFPNGKDYNKKYERYDLVINDLYSKKHFATLFQSKIDYKNQKLEDIKKLNYKQNVKPIDYILVKKVTKTSVQENVWDIEVFDKDNCFSLSHCITHNCSELNLSVLDSCRLISLNLFSFVDNPFTTKAKFNYEKLSEVTMIAQRLMDDLVDLESEKVQKIIDKVKKDPEPMKIKKDEIELWETIKKNNDEGRRTGLGFMGLADVFAALGMKYGEEDSIRKVEKISKTIKLAAYRSSVEMAKELGHFKCYDAKKEENHPFIKRIAKEDEHLYKDMRKYGRRNVALLTVPPTGSISIEAGVSSGIEPLFEISYTRRKKINDSTNERSDFTDVSGDKWQEFKVFHNRVKEWMEVTGEKNAEKSPWFGSCANDINWVNRVKLQGTIQKHICHSISSTINLPKDVSVESVAKIYETAWKEGLKGITVYRDGCRSGVLVKKDDCNREAPKRPKELPCEIYHTNITKKLDKVRTFKYMVMIGIMEDAPYEIFAIENGQYKHTKGKVIKIKRGHYDLEFENGEKVENFTKDTTDNEDSLTRMVSTSLRHKVPIHFICEQLNKVEGEMFCFSKSIARALKKYIKDGTKSGEDCQNCGARLVYENGCFTCKSCGFSKCG